MTDPVRVLLRPMPSREEIGAVLVGLTQMLQAQGLNWLEFSCDDITDSLVVRCWHQRPADYQVAP